MGYEKRNKRHAQRKHDDKKKERKEKQPKSKKKINERDESSKEFIHHPPKTIHTLTHLDQGL